MINKKGIPRGMPCDSEVGVPGFEPGASCTPCKRATRLRHTP